jgi:hypothetical protein
MDTSRVQDRRIEPLGVVVGVDGSRIALDAVRWAVAEAGLRGLPLQIVHAARYAVNFAVGMHRARDILARAFTVAHRAEPGLPVTTHRTEQDAARSLLDAARHAELLVVGMGGGDVNPAAVRPDDDPVTATAAPHASRGAVDDPPDIRATRSD